MTSQRAQQVYGQLTFWKGVRPRQPRCVNHIGIKLFLNISRQRVEYHNHTLQTNQRHHEEKQQNSNSHKAPGRQLKQSNQLSLPHQDDCKIRKDTK